jgi:hypothetical protein
MLVNMNRLFFSLVIIVILSISLIYIFIPGNLVVSKIVAINCTPNGTYRNISDENNWKKRWLKNDSAVSNENSSPGSFNYSIDKRLNNGTDIFIENKNLKLPATVNLIARGTDSTILQLICNISTSNNPVTKILRYKEAIEVKKNIDTVITNMRVFLQNPDNVYGMTIRKSLVTDSFLIAKKYISNAPPTNEEIYKSIGFLKKYITKNGAVETNSPMFNVTSLINNQFQVMVAVPINKPLPGEGDFFPRKMVDGRFMVSEVHGGTYTVNKAFEMMRLYFDDYQKILVAIPFQHLITDRIAQPDTTKWVTKIYWPVVK